MSNKNLVPFVAVFTEVTDSCGDEVHDRIRANMLTRIKAGGYREEDATWCVNRHIAPNGKVYYIHVVTVMPSTPPLKLASDT